MNLRVTRLRKGQQILRPAHDHPFDRRIKEVLKGSHKVLFQTMGQHDGFFYEDADSWPTLLKTGRRERHGNKT